MSAATANGFRFDVTAGANCTAGSVLSSVSYMGSSSSPTNLPVGVTTPVLTDQPFSRTQSATFRISGGAGVGPVLVWINRCATLAGSGIAQDPWLVGSDNHFLEIGQNGCNDWGHFRQTAPFDLSVAGSGAIHNNFRGVYDGDHYEITYPRPASGTNKYLFGNLRLPDSDPVGEYPGPAAIKKLRLSGTIVSNGDLVASVVDSLQQGGVISEVHSSVRIEVTSSNPGRVGGLVVRATGSGVGTSLLQYSTYSGSISWTSSTAADRQWMGGLVGEAKGLWLRDSYSTASLSHSGPTDYAGNRVGLGGLIGNTNASDVHIIRSYSAATYETTCQQNCTNVSIGGLIGAQRDGEDVEDNKGNMYSSFWLSSSTPSAFGDGIQPVPYTTTGTTGLPKAVGVNTQTLRTITTFQSKGDVSGPFGASTGENSLPTGASTGTVSANDYRWAIEPGNVETFVAQKRVAPPALVGETATFTRAFDRLLWTNSDVPEATYRTRGASKTLPEGSYPDLGRVWEICSGVNNGYPVLVWEDRNCQSGGDDGGGTERNREKPTDANVAAAQAAGLSGAELEAFLASGLTLEQWLAQRLAATGTSGEVVNLSLLVAGMLSIIGLGLVVSARRQTRGRLARPSP